MSEEERVRVALVQRFALPPERVRIQRARRVWLEVEMGRFPQVFDFAVRELGFPILCTVTGLDEGPDLGYLYLLARPGGLMLMVKTRAPKDQPIASVTPTFPNAAIYERELADLLGARVEGVPPGVRYPLPDDWPPGQYPLRKDWQADMLKPGEGVRYE